MMSARSADPAVTPAQLNLSRARLEVSSGSGQDRPRLLSGAQPILLRTATEHYGAVTNRAVRFERYIPFLAGSGCNLTRTFVFFRELQSAVNPYSTCKPESIDYVAPYRRTTGLALDGQPQFDLTQWNDEYFDRLHRFLSMCQDYSVFVELTLLSNVYGSAVWALQPFHPDNNVNEVGECQWWEFLTQRNSKIFQHQKELVVKIVSETVQYANVIYEPCNEPGAAPRESIVAGREPTTQAEVNDWQREVIKLIRDTAAEGGGSQLIAGQEAFQYEPWEQPLNASYDEMDFDIVNVHPLPNITIDGESFELGRFMSGDLALDHMARFCAMASKRNKPLNLDEDNAGTQYTNEFGWSVHRRRAWIAIMSGCHYDMIDFTVRPGAEDGTEQSRAILRTWTTVLGRAVDSYGLGDADFWLGVRVEAPEEWVSVGCRTDDTFLAYLADAEEVSTTQGASDGERLLVLEVELPVGGYNVVVTDPRSGSERHTMLEVARSEMPQSSRTQVELPIRGLDALITFQPTPNLAPRHG